MNYASLIESLKKYDFSFFIAAFAIFFIGIINLYSATHASESLAMSNLYKIQLMWFAISLSVAIGVSFIRMKNLFSYSYFIYGFNIILLILVLVLGKKGMGAQRWLVLGALRVQPSELMKISVILALAKWFSRRHLIGELGLKELILPAMIAIFPALLIIAEPDLGTGLLILLIFSMIAFYRRLKWKTMAIIAIIVLASGSVMYKFGLKDYQRRRIVTFLNPGDDARGSGYNAIQSKIAIGSGQFLGKGFKKSSQASLQYLPENHTDFIFSIFNEEHGFFGSIVLICLYFILFYRFIWLSTSVTRVYDSVVTMGLMSIFFWHTFINMGMVMGLMPIVGLPLPFMSYGGSSLMTFMVCCGIATSISNSRNLF
ncbi:MAG: rod shape-determining protein RodA [Bacteriovoracaceae bacterium]|nr:rod shape-determining protein RodA [Bacteriovoracaceae bacterium]